MVNALAQVDPGEDVVLLMPPLGRDDDLYRLTDDLVGTGPEQPFAAAFQVRIVPWRS
jgi:hypothetical protein